MAAPSPSKSSLIGYEDYMVLMAWLDAHWTRGTQEKHEEAGKNGDSFWKTFHDFQRACALERHGKYENIKDVGALEDYLRETGLTTEEEAKQKRPTAPKKGEESEEEPLRDFLARPVPFMALGRPDVLGLTLVDDLDMPQWILANTDLTIEEATMAFCIKPGPFLQRHAGLKHHLVSMETMVTDRLENDEIKQPLLVLVRMKLEGFSMLLDPVETQEAVLDVACRRIQSTWQALKNYHQDHSESDQILAKADVEEDSWRLSILDLQEEEEIGFLFTCHNLSVPATFIGALRGLTLKDLRDESPQFDALLKSKEAEDIVKACKDVLDPKADPPLNGRSEDACHVFRWTRSSVALHLKCFEEYYAEEPPDPDTSLVRGFCASLSQCQVPAGHSHPAAQLLDSSLPDKAAYLPSGAHEWQPCLLGNVDMLAGSLIAEKGSIIGARWMPEAAYRHTGAVFTTLAGLRKNIPKSISAPSRHFSGWATTLIVPQPKDLMHEGVCLMSDLRKEDPTHFPFLSHVIVKLTKAMVDPMENRRVPQFFRHLMQTSGIPITLRRAFMVLFEKYLSLAVHPMRYETVLDIYDTMQTLSDVLTKWLPEMLSPPSRSGIPPRSVPRLPEKSVRFLFDFATAVESAIDLRLRRFFPESPRHEWDLDFRGSMCQVVMAGETVLRAALGIVRRNVLGENTSFRKLGVVNRITVTSGIYHVLPGLGVESNARLSYVDTDVGHLTHLSQLADYFHEAYHLIHEEMELNGKNPPPVPPGQNVCQIRGRLDALPVPLQIGNSKEYLSELTSEVFVGMMMLLTVADGDEDLLWAQHAVTFASDPKSAFGLSGRLKMDLLKAQQEIHVNYASVMIPLGIVSALILPLKQELEQTWKAAGRTGCPPPADLVTLCLEKYIRKEQPELISPKEASDCFVEHCKIVHRLLPDDIPIRTDDPEDELWRHHVLQTFGKAWMYVTTSNPGLIHTLWKSALEVLECFMRDATQNTRPENLAADWRTLITHADRLMSHTEEASTPVSPSAIYAEFDLFNNRHTPPDGKRIPTTDAQMPALGTVFVIRALHWVWLRYVPQPAQEMRDKPPSEWREWRLPRKIVKEGNGFKVKILWKSGHYCDNYHDFLVDTMRPEGFCIRPEKRAQRLRDQAVFMKTLWGISYIIRRRRLEAMINEYKKRNQPPAAPESSA